MKCGDRDEREARKLEEGESCGLYTTSNFERVRKLN